MYRRIDCFMPYVYETPLFMPCAEQLPIFMPCVCETPLFMPCAEQLPIFMPCAYETPLCMPCAEQLSIFMSTPTSSTTKTGRHDIAEISLKVALKHQKI